MKRTLVITLMVAILLSACAPAAVQSNPTAQTTAEPAATEEVITPTQAPTGEDKLGGAAIVYQRSGGFAGVNEKWEVFPDGRVVSSKGEQHTIPAEQVATLLEAIEALGFFEMKDAYGLPSQCKDCYTYTVSVSSGGKVKSVTTIDNAGDVPPELGQVFEKINTLLTELK